MKNGKALPKSGAVCQQFVEVGGKRYGPYWYLFWREKGRLMKRYVRPDELEAVRDHCEAARKRRQAVARSRREIRETLGTFKAMMNAVIAFERDEDADLTQVLCKRDVARIRANGVPI